MDFWTFPGHFAQQHAPAPAYDDFERDAYGNVLW
jgi:hypothetical protein